MQSSDEFQVIVTFWPMVKLGPPYERSWTNGGAPSPSPSPWASNCSGLGPAGQLSHGSPIPSASASDGEGLAIKGQVSVASGIPSESASAGGQEPVSDRGVPALVRPEPPSPPALSPVTR